jgi:hypothetical protein
MATFVCIHGAGGRASHWDLLATELGSLGHDVVAMDLPCEDEVGLGPYVDAVVDAIDGRQSDLVLVAQSLAGLIAPLVADRVPVELMVLLAAMVPRPGETGGEWWANTGHAAAFDAQGLPDDSEATVFTHDVPPEVLAATDPSRGQTDTLFVEPAPAELARRADPVRRLPRRPLLPRRLAARRGPGPPRHRTDRDPRRPLRLPVPARRPGPRPRSLLDRTLT